MKRSTSNKKQRRRGIGTLIGAVIAIILIVFLLNPQWILNPDSAKSMQEITKEHFLIEGSLKISGVRLLNVLLAVCIVWLLYIILRFLLDLIGKKNARVSTITTLVKSFLKYFAVIAAIIWGLGILGVNMTAVFAGVGIVGLALGFGAQSLIEDIITGFFIIFEGQYGIGDIIVLDDFRGIVRNIGVRTTVLEDAGGNLKIVNNSDIRNLQNRSRNASLAICEVDVSYNTDLKTLERMLPSELDRMLAEHPNLYLSAPEYMGVEDLGESGVRLRFCVSCNEENVFAAKRRLARDLRVLFAEKNVEIPFPQVVIHQGD
ncbi:MAG: mechanosensitive ion channel family protein [Clostridia bacterium]|nr:mechanosensitive ion channel family protein [Clostridia bacterium]